MRSCVIVGNSTALLDKEYGEFIDSHDRVIRMNRVLNLLPQYEKQLGKKTDMLTMARPVESLPQHPDIDIVMWLCSEQEYNERCTDDIKVAIEPKFYAGGKLLFYNQSRREQLKKIIGKLPTAGMMTVEWVVRQINNHTDSLFPGNWLINIIGFDFFEHASIVTGQNNSAKWHNPDAERVIIETFAMLGYINIIR